MIFIILAQDKIGVGEITFNAQNLNGFESVLSDDQ